MEPQEDEANKQNHFEEIHLNSTTMTENDTLLLNAQSTSSPGRDENLAKVEIATLSFILLLAIIGNGLMLIALRKQLQFRPMSRMYFFMLNLSIADLLVAFGNILPQLAWDITYRFKGPDLLCRVVKFLQIFVLYLSTYVLTSMAVDRYLVVCHHSFSRNYYGGIKGPKILVIGAYILAFILASPQAFIFGLEEFKESSGQTVMDCWATFIEPWGSKVYVTFFVLCAFIVPLIIIGLSYGAIWYKVSRYKLPEERNGSRLRQQIDSHKKSISVSSTSDYRYRNDTNEESCLEEVPLQKISIERSALERQLSQAKMKTLKLTAVVVICFFVCWAPFCVTHLVMAYHPHDAGPLQVILLLLASLNSCTNPWIYLAFSESLRNQLRVFLGFPLKRGSDEESIGDDKNDPDMKKHPRDKNLQGIPQTQPVYHIQTSVAKRSRNEDQKPETKSDFL